MIDYKIKNKIAKPELDSIKVGGYYGDSIDTFLEGRVTSDYAQSVAYKEAEDAFVNQLDDKAAAGLWQGEFWGKWIISACRAAYFAVYSLCDLGFFEESGKIGRAKAFRKTY